MNLLISALSFLIIVSLIKVNSFVLALWDTGVQGYFLEEPPKLISHLVVNLSKPSLCYLYIAILWFLLWGFKHKILAFWVVCTYVFGDVFFLVVRQLVNRPRPIGHPKGLTNIGFPSHHMFAIIMVMYLVFIGLSPLIENDIKKWFLVTAMILMTVLVFIACVRLKINFPIDMIGSVILAYIWSQIAEFAFLHWFADLRQFEVFKNSDFN